MKRVLAVMLSSMLVAGFAPAASADATSAECVAAAKLFQNAGQSSAYFSRSYGYAIYPTVGKAGLGIGGAHGTGCVFAKGAQIGTTAMSQLSFGWQAGAQGYSLILFFQDERSFREFASGNFEFGANASAVAITAGASAGAGTTGAGAGASATKNTAVTAGAYYKGVAPFSIVKGGVMYEAALSGAKFSYKPM